MVGAGVDGGAVGEGAGCSNGPGVGCGVGAGSGAGVGTRDGDGVGAGAVVVHCCVTAEERPEKSGTYAMVCVHNAHARKEGKDQEAVSGYENNVYTAHCASRFKAPGWLWEARCALPGTYVRR